MFRRKFGKTPNIPEPIPYGRPHPPFLKALKARKRAALADSMHHQPGGQDELQPNVISGYPVVVESIGEDDGTGANEGTTNDGKSCEVPVPPSTAV